MLSLKRNYITALLHTLLVLCILESCIADRLSDDISCLPDEASQFLGIKLRFDTDTFTRADDEEADEENTENTEFEQGTDEEHKIALSAKNFVILFKKDYEGVDRLLGIYDFWDTEQNTDIDDTDYEEAEAKYTYVARIPAQDIEDWKGSCLVVLNGKADVYDELKETFEGKNVTLKEILTAAWKEALKEEDPRDIGYADKNHRFFTMTNSVYYDVENNKPTKLHVAEEFSAKEHVKKTYAQAKREPITVYVERMVAKFSFGLINNKRVFQPSERADMITFKGFKDDGSPDYQAKKWQIEVTGWNANALETKSYLFKKLPDLDAFDKWPGFKWNNSDNFRSYWCEDPHYDNQYDEKGNKLPNSPWQYSWQYRKSVDYKLDNYFTYDEKSGEYLLRNYSFNDLKLGKPSHFHTDDELKTYIDDAFNPQKKVVYTPENTYDPLSVLKSAYYPGLDSRDEVLAGSHLLVGAEFQIQRSTGEDTKYYMHAKEDDNESVYRAPVHLFRDRTGFHYLSERECVAALMHDFNQLLKSQSTMVFRSYNWEVEGMSPVELIADTKGEYCLFYKKNGEWNKLNEADILKEDMFSDEELEMPIAAVIRGGDGKRLPWISELVDNDRLAIGLEEQSEPTCLIYHTKKDEYGTSVKDTDKEVVPADKNHLKSLFYEWLGAIDHFNEGKMYYAVPVKNASYTVKDDKKDKLIEKDLFGVVRNNWYKFTLEDVKALGTPVDDLDQPIVPEVNGLHDQINYSIRILDWHYVETDLKLDDIKSN